MTTTAILDDDNSISAIQGGPELFRVLMRLQAIPAFGSTRAALDLLHSLAAQTGPIYVDGRGQITTNITSPEETPEIYQAMAETPTHLVLRHTWKGFYTDIRFASDEEGDVQVDAIGYGREQLLPETILMKLEDEEGIFQLNVRHYENEDERGIRICATRKLVGAITTIKQAHSALSNLLREAPVAPTPAPVKS